MLIYGVAFSLFPNERHEDLAVWVLILAIGLSNWVNFARTVRGSTLVEKNKEYVQSARVIGRRRATIMFRHILPNVMGPVLVIAQDFLFAGEWWIVIFPGMALAVLILAVNLLGDWMRDAFNPKLR